MSLVSSRQILRIQLKMAVCTYAPMSSNFVDFCRSFDGVTRQVVYKFKLLRVKVARQICIMLQRAEMLCRSVSLHGCRSKKSCSLCQPRLPRTKACSEYDRVALDVRFIETQP